VTKELAITSPYVFIPASYTCSRRSHDREPRAIDNRIDAATLPRVANGHLITSLSLSDAVILGRSDDVNHVHVDHVWTEKGELRTGNGGKVDVFKLFRVASLIHLNKSYLRSPRVLATVITLGGRPFGLIAHDVGGKEAHSTPRCCERISRHCERIRAATLRNPKKKGSDTREKKGDG